MSDAATWQTTDDFVRLLCGPLSGALNPTDPAAGLHDLRLANLAGPDHSGPNLVGASDPAAGDIALPGTLLAVETPAGALGDPAETYVRGGDHVSTHEPSPSFPFRTQLYWSAQMLPGGAVAATLCVSLQTDLLDTSPGLTLRTRLNQEPPCEATPCLAAPDAWRLSTNGVTAIVTPHPSDAAECDAAADPAGCVLRLSPPFLEKGVIRRVRVAVLLMPGEPDDSAIATALADFADEPLPLTT